MSPDAMLSHQEPLWQQLRLCVRRRLRHELHNRNVQHRHDESGWLDGASPGSERGTGSRAEHMI
jgi:hypothetical protein